MSNSPVTIHPRKIEALVVKIEALAQQAEDFSPGGTLPRQSLSTDQAQWSFSGEAIQSYADFVRHLLDKEQWGQKYSEKHTEFIARQWVGLALSGAGPDALKAAVQTDLMAYATYTNLQEVYVPISGIDIQDDELKLGNLVVRRATPELATLLSGRFETIVDQGLNSPSEKTSLKQIYGQTIGQLITASDLILVATVNAEPVKAEELAIGQANQLLSFFHAALPLLRPEYSKIKISLLEDAVRPVRRTLVIQSDSTSCHFNESTQFDQFKLILTPQMLDFVREYGVLFPLESAASSVSPSELEARLIEAVSWMSNAVTQKENRNKILSLTTILELFFGPGKDSGLSISAAVADGIALLSETGVAERMNVRSTIKNLYDKRSSVTHGNPVVIYDLDVADAMHFAHWTLHYMYDNRANLQNLQDLRKKIDNLKFS